MDRKKPEKRKRSDDGNSDEEEQKKETKRQRSSESSEVKTAVTTAISTHPPSPTVISFQESEREELLRQAQATKYYSMFRTLKAQGHFEDVNLPPQFLPYCLFGTGAYADVFVAFDVRRHCKVVLKKNRAVFDHPDLAKRLLREIKILRMVHHPNIVQFHGVLRPANLSSYNSLYFVMEFMDTDLHRLIQSDQFITAAHVKHIMRQLCRGLLVLHSSNIIHRDLKPANILCSAKVDVQICDFGLARLAVEDVPESAAAVPIATPTAPAGVIPLRRAPSLRRSLSTTTGGDAKSATPARTSSDGLSTTAGLTMTSSSSSSALSAAAEAAAAASDALPPDTPAGALAANLGDLSMTALPVPKSPPMRKIKREMTQRVVTRWYRAPELILTPSYTFSIDMWSAGCVLAELLEMLAEGRKGPRQRRVLFPGKTCLPLEEPENLATFEESQDQLIVILNVIGSPTDEELDSVGPSEELRKRIKSLPHHKRANFRERWPWARDEQTLQALDLLDKLLQFDPSRRLTAEEALEHPFLADPPSPDMLKGVEITEDFSFEDHPSSIPRMRELLLQQILRDHPSSPTPPRP